MGMLFLFGVGPIHHITTIMDQHVYVDILDKVMLPYADYEMPLVVPTGQ